jgi:Holliday junction resolvasome RuvABC endonuclease subunit
MKALGVRAEKDLVHWAVVELRNDELAIVREGKHKVTETFDLSARLKELWTKTQGIIETHGVDAVAIRFQETHLQRGIKDKLLASALQRARLEGVVAAASAAAGVDVFCGSLQQIGSAIGSKRPKAYIETGEFRGIDLSKKNKHIQEAILAAAAALTPSGTNE